MPEGVALARDLVGPAIESAIARLSLTCELSPAYHLGFADAAGKPTRNGSGKALRPALALLSARAAGATPERGVPDAVAVELVHNFSLLHDDIMDERHEARHRRQPGPCSASARRSWAATRCSRWRGLLLEDATPQGAWAARCLSAAVHRLIAGQGRDLAFEKRDDVTLAECQEMAGTRGRADGMRVQHRRRAPGRAPALAMGLAAFGAHVGLAFQLPDDLLGIWGAPEVTGKPVRADLRARKKSLPVVAALNSGSPARRRAARDPHRPGAAQRGRPGPRGGPRGGGGRPGWPRTRPTPSSPPPTQAWPTSRSPSTSVPS